MGHRGNDWWLVPHLSDGILPLTVDFSALPDGALPTQLAGATWAIASGKAVNTPTLGPTELLTDPGLEANYTAGLCDTLQTFTAPNVTQSADVHGGSKAQQFQATATQDQVRWTITPVANTWYQSSLWVKRLAGTDGKVIARSDQASAKPQAQIFRVVDSATYDQLVVVHRTVSTATFIWTLIQNGAAAVYDTVLIDDGSRKVIAFPTMLATAKRLSSWTVRAAINLDQGLVGVASHVDDPTNPQSGIFAYWYRNSAYTYYIVEKLVNGSWSTVLGPTLVDAYSSFVPGLLFEIRYLSANTFGLFYDNVQLETDMTISDAPIVGNKYYGMFAAGGSSVSSFFCGSTLTSFNVGAFGSSITEPSTSYAWLVKDWLRATELDKSVNFTNQAKSGHWPFSNLIRYPAELQTEQPVNLFLCDYRIVNVGRDDKALEALTRRIFADNPNAVIVAPIIPVDTNSNGQVDDLTNEDNLSIALANQYGVHLVDYRQAVIDLVAGGASLSTYMADTIHPTAAGHQLCAQMIEAAIVAGGWLNPENHATLPARLYDDGGYEREPTRTLGIGYDAITGTWTTTGTRIDSSEAGATVSFTATCQQFGIYRSDSGYTQPEMDVQIDAGDWTLAQICTHNGYYGAPPSYGAHTITFRVRAGQPIRIDEFWVI